MSGTAGHIAAIACSLGFAQVALASGDCGGLPYDERHLPGEHLGKAWKRQNLPANGDVDDALTRLDSLDEGPQVQLLDLDGDGKAELLLASPNGRLWRAWGSPIVLRNKWIRSHDR